MPDSENYKEKEENNVDKKVISSEIGIIEEQFRQSGDHNLKKNLFLVFMLVLYLLVNLAAAAIFIKIEKKSREGQPHWLPFFKEEFLKNHSICLNETELEKFLEKLEEAAMQDSVSIVGNSTIYPEQWTLNSAFFLSITIASTIGYGTLTPVTPGGQIFASLFALISIPFTGILAAKIGIATAYYVEKLFARLLELVYKVNWASISFTVVVGFLLYILMPTFILYFISNEEQWTFVNCFYCVIISLTTIGFGDFVPDPHEEGGLGASMLILIWVVAGLAWFATLIQLISTQLTIHAATLQKKVEDTSPALIQKFQDTGNTFTLAIQEIQGSQFVFGRSDDTNSMLKTDNTENVDQNPQDDEKLKESEIRRSGSARDSDILGPGSFHAAVMAQSDDASVQKNSQAPNR